MTQKQSWWSDNSPVRIIIHIGYIHICINLFWTDIRSTPLVDILDTLNNKSSLSKAHINRISSTALLPYGFNKRDQTSCLLPLVRPTDCYVTHSKHAMKNGTGHVVMSIRIRDYPTNFNRIRYPQSAQEAQITALGIWRLVVCKTVTEVTGDQLARSSILKEGFMPPKRW